MDHTKKKPINAPSPHLIPATKYLHYHKIQNKMPPSIITNHFMYILTQIYTNVMIFAGLMEIETKRHD